MNNLNPLIGGFRSPFFLENIINYNTLYSFFEDCKKSKMWKNSVLDFDLFKDQLIQDIIYDMYTHPYFDPMYHTIINERGKERLICSLTIRDRAIQKTLNQNFLLPAIRPTLIEDNTASLTDRGMDYALNRLKMHIEKQYRQIGSNNFFFLKMDMKDYFNSIPHEPIKQMIYSKTDDSRVVNIIEHIFKAYYYDPFIQGGQQIPVGIGLGGEVPQTIGIIALNELDHLSKERFRFKHYIRYMDDIIIVHEDPVLLENYLKFVQLYLYEAFGGYLKLNLNKSKIFPGYMGVKFLKMHFHISETGKVWLTPNKKGIKKEIRKLRSLKTLMEAGVIKFTDVRANYASYRGHVQRADSKYWLEKLDTIFAEEIVYSYIENGFFDLDQIKLPEDYGYDIGVMSANYGYSNSLSLLPAIRVAI